jgi:hypothetical protein
MTDDNTSDFSEDLLRYDLLTENAMRSVMHQVLSQVCLTGLPGDHHFFITFKTKAHGVQIAPRLQEAHPDEMTIVLQHQYKDLQVAEDHFSVSLSFNNIPETLIIPFSSVVSFFDPSVEFGLRFGSVETLEELEQLIGTDADDFSNNFNPESSATKSIRENTESAEIVDIDSFRKK